MLSVAPVDKSLAASLEAFRNLMKSGQYTRVTDEMTLHEKYLPNEVKNSVEFYKLAVAASLKAGKTDKAMEFHNTLAQCKDYKKSNDAAEAIEAEITQLVNEPSQDLIDRLARALKQWWTRTTRR
jgi:hypothetical protein